MIINYLNLIRKNVELILALFVFFAGLFLIFYSIFKLNLNYFFFGVFQLICIIIYYLIRERNLSVTQIVFSSYKSNKLSDILFTLLLISGILSIYHHSISYERPFSFFIIFACMIITILIQILSGIQNSYNIIIKLFFSSLFFILSQALLFNSLMSIDSYTHIFWTQIIIDSEYLPQFNIYYSYLFHILHAQIQLILGVSYNHSNLLIILPIIIIITICIVFKIGKELVSPQIGQFSSLILICSTTFIYFTTNLIPNTYSSIFFLLGLMILVQKNKFYVETRYSILLAFLVVLITLTHPLTNILFFIFMLIYIISINSGANREKKLIFSQDVYLILFSFFFMLSYWIYVNNLFYRTIDFIQLGMNYFEPSTFANESIIGLLPKQSIIERFHMSMSFFLIWIIGVPGCLYLTRNNYGKKQNSFAYVGFFVMGLMAIVIISGKEFINIRFFYLITFIFTIFFAIFITLILQSIKRSLLKILTLIIVILICTIGFTHPLANITNPLYSKPTGPKIYPQESESLMMTTLRLFNSKTLASDGTFTYCEQMLGKSDIKDISNIIQSLNFKNGQDFTIILSDSIFKSSYSNTILYPEKNFVIFSLDDYQFSKIFDIGRVRAYSHN